jgi:hypothetical protein
MKQTGTADLAHTISPSYNSPLQNMLRDATRYMIQDCKDLRFLAYLNFHPHDANMSSYCPSWVPHFHLQRNGFQPTAVMLLFWMFLFWGSRTERPFASQPRNNKNT